MNCVRQNGFRGLDRAVTAVGIGGLHGESEARSGLSTNPHESTRTGIRENPCQSVDKTSAIQSTVGQFSWTYHADASLKASLAYAAG